MSLVQLGQEHKELPSTIKFSFEKPSLSVPLVSTSSCLLVSSSTAVVHAWYNHSALESFCYQLFVGLRTRMFFHLLLSFSGLVVFLWQFQQRRFEVWEISVSCEEAIIPLTHSVLTMIPWWNPIRCYVLTKPYPSFHRAVFSCFSVILVWSDSFHSCQPSLFRAVHCKTPTAMTGSPREHQWPGHSAWVFLGEHLFGGGLSFWPSGRLEVPEVPLQYCFPALQLEEERSITSGVAE